MKIETVLSSLEEYLEMRRDVGSDDHSFLGLSAARHRAELALKEYIGSQFNYLMVEERRVSTTPTRKVDVVNPKNTSIAWEEVVGLIDALNSPPTPMRNFSDPKAVERWMKVYRDWYEFKRKAALKVNPLIPLELDLSEEDKI